MTIRVTGESILILCANKSSVCKLELNRPSTFGSLFPLILFHIPTLSDIGNCNKIFVFFNSLKTN
jgi:hypothetical protein